MHSDNATEPCLHRVRVEDELAEGHVVVRPRPARPEVRRGLGHGVRADGEHLITVLHAMGVVRAMRYLGHDVRADVVAVLPQPLDAQAGRLVVE